MPVCACTRLAGPKRLVAEIATVAAVVDSAAARKPLLDALRVRALRLLSSADTKPLLLRSRDSSRSRPKTPIAALSATRAPAGRFSRLTKSSNCKIAPEMIP